MVAGRIIYLHGFRSSSQSFKARLLAARLERSGQAGRWVCPDLPVSPRAAMELVGERIGPNVDDTIIGSSLGGAYATAWAERSGCRAVLVNPAVRPSRELAQRVGLQTGWHDGQPFEFRAEYVDELRAIETARITRPSRYWLIAATHDEALDWREMVAHYPGARHTIVHGGDHGLSGFADFSDAVIRFASAD